MVIGLSSDQGHAVFFFSKNLARTSSKICCDLETSRIDSADKDSKDTLLTDKDTKDTLLTVAALPSADELRPAPATAVLLNASGSEDSHRGHTSRRRSAF